MTGSLMADEATPIEIAFTGEDGYPLAGELLVPANARALAVIHSGSTLSDRDGNVPRIRMRSTMYRKLAQLFAERGVATFRFGKRQWDRPKPEPLDYSLSDRVGDYCQAWHAATSHDAVATMSAYLVGHSEGGVIAQLTAIKLADRGNSPTGVAVLASPAIPMMDSMMWRASNAVAKMNSKHRGAGEAMIAANYEWRRRAVLGEDYAPDEFERYLEYYTPMGGTQGWEAWPWLKEHAQLQITEHTPKLPCKALYLHGDHDRLVDIANLDRYREAASHRNDFIFEEVPEVGHYLEDSTRKAFVVSERLVDRVTHWLVAGE